MTASEALPKKVSRRQSDVLVQLCTRFPATDKEALALCNLDIYHKGHVRMTRCPVRRAKCELAPDTFEHAL